MSVEPVEWKNLPDTSTPLDAGTLNAMQGYVRTQAEAAATSATAAAQSAAEAAAPTDTTVANLLGSEESATRVALDALLETAGGGYVLAVANEMTPDGVTDCGPALNALTASVAALGGGAILLTATDDGAVYLTKETIDLPSNVRLLGDGVATLDYSQAVRVGLTRTGIRAAGTVGTSTLLTADATKGAATVAVTSAAGISVGDWVQVGSGAHYPYGGDVDVDRGEIKRVRAIDGTTLTLEQPLYDDYATTDSAFVAPLTMVENVAVENLRIVGSATAAAQDRAIELRYVDGFRVTGCTITGADIYCVHLSSAIRGSVIDNRMRGVHYDGVTGGIFYAVSVMNSCQWVRVNSNHAEQVRHHTTISSNGGGQGFWGYPRFVTVVGNVAQNMQGTSPGRSWAFEHHGFGDGIVIASNVADGCYGGFCTRGPGVTFEGNVVRSWYQHALEIHSQTVDARNIIIRGNQVSDRVPGATNPVAIKIVLDAATTVRNVVVEGNVLEVDSTGSEVRGGIHATGTIEGGLTIERNLIAWVGDATATSWLVQSALPGTVMDDNRIVGDVRYGIRASGARSEVSWNRMVAASQQTIGEAVYVEAADCVVQGNRSRLTRYTVRTPSAATGLILHSNIGESSGDPFSLGTTTGLDAKVNVWKGGTTAVNN